MLRNIIVRKVNKKGAQELKGEQKDEKDIDPSEKDAEQVYTSSVVIPEGSFDEAQELAKYAVISQEEAITAALKEVKGNIDKVFLENENGNVVYSVEISTPTGVKDVKVDAGNGQILCIVSEDSNEVNGQDGQEVDEEA